MIGLPFTSPETAGASVSGTNVPALAITSSRVAALPAWQAYHSTSIKQCDADQAFLRAELEAHGMKQSAEPPESRGGLGKLLKKPESWFASLEALRIATNIISFQTPAGGWGKNTDFTTRPRAAGEAFAAKSISLHPSARDFDAVGDGRWSYIGTFDNGATTGELRFLAKVRPPNPRDARLIQDAFGRGLRYIFAAQFPNGGWPQVWPLQGGYHDQVTFNDNAMVNILELLRDVGAGREEFTGLPEEWRAAATRSWQRGLDCLLTAQITVGGRLTVWAQQHDALTLAPGSARNYEMPAQASGESAGIMRFLMRLPQPDSRVIRSVHAAAAWFTKTKICDKTFRGSKAEGRMLRDAPGSEPIWARYYEIGTDRPIYGDRDKSIHDDVNEISRERRQGYAWFQSAPLVALEDYARWSLQHPKP